MSDVALHRETIRKGSKSFAAASLFFSKKQKEAAWRLYSWCRYCDDQIDDVPRSAAVVRLQELRAELQAGAASSAFVFRELARVSNENLIPIEYPEHLLRGMQMDVNGRTYDTLAELEEYCFCVAGVVGLMMCHVMGVTSDQALRHAVALGNAMQLTNICRDISEDFSKGRVYLPLQWLHEAGVPAEELLQPRYIQRLIEVQEMLLHRADELYREGYDGLRYLSFRSAWAVLIAGLVYGAIGSKIRKSSGRGLDQRIYVTGLEKIILIGKATSVLLRLWVSARLGRNSFRAPQKVWRFE